MKLFRKIKYRLRRFIISLISVLCLCCVFIVSASADVLPIGSNIYTQVDPYYWNGSQWVYSDTVEFVPGKTVNTGFNVPLGNSFGMTFNCNSTTDSNNLNIDVGVLHFRISFDTNIYFTSPQVPYVSFGKLIPGSNGTSTVTSSTVESDYIDYDYTVTRYGSQNKWLVTTDLYIDSKYVPYKDFFYFYFYIQRDKAATSHDTWIFTPRELTVEVLTGADAPKYQKPDDTAKNELNSVEGALNDTVDSFGSGLGNIFNFDNFSGLVSGMNFWTGVISPLFSLDYIAPILSFSLAVGIFSLLFGLFSSLAGRSGKRSKPKKQKGG